MVYLECLEGVFRVSWKCLVGCLLSDWKLFGVCMKRVSGKIYLSNNFFGLQIFDTYGKDTWVKTGLVNSLIKIFFGLSIIMESNFFISNFFCINFSWHQDLAQLKSRVWHSWPSLFYIFSPK